MENKENITLTQLALQNAARIKVLEQAVLTMLDHRPDLAEEVALTLKAQPDLGVSPDDILYGACRDRLVGFIEDKL